MTVYISNPLSKCHECATLRRPAVTMSISVPAHSPTRWKRPTHHISKTLGPRQSRCDPNTTVVIARAVDLHTHDTWREVGRTEPFLPAHVAVAPRHHRPAPRQTPQRPDKGLARQIQALLLEHPATSTQHGRVSSPHKGIMEVVRFLGNLRFNTAYTLPDIDH
jgi:hypothetical protein